MDAFLLYFTCKLFNDHQCRWLYETWIFIGKTIFRWVRICIIYSFANQLSTFWPVIARICLNWCLIDNVFWIGAGMTLPYWDFTGSTLVTSNYIRLTPDIQSRSGAVWNSVVRIIVVCLLNVLETSRIKIPNDDCWFLWVYFFILILAMYVKKLGSEYKF